MPNRLADEKSPYLLQHAGNPVNWYAWGEERVCRGRAAGQAHLPVGRVLDVPLVPRDGARVVREHIGGRRAERALHSREGRSRGAARRRSRLHDLRAGDHGRRRLADERLAHAVARAVLRRHVFPARRALGPAGLRRGAADDRARVGRRPPAGREVGGGARRRLAPRQRRPRDDDRLAPPWPARMRSRSVSASSRWRSTPGAAGSATQPKFPRPSELLFLLREHARTGDTDARDMVLLTLRAMALGGMRDQIGGGFHRYSVDGDWRVPHFEKMLYDQAQLVLAYLEAAQATGDRFFAQVADDTLQYVGRELTSAEGGFYSAEDADSVPPEAPAGEHVHPVEGRLLHLARVGSARRARRGLPGVRRAVRRRGGRQRAVRSAGRVHREEPLLHREERGGHRGADRPCACRGRRSPGARADRVVRRAAAASAAAPGRQGAGGLERPDDRGLCARVARAARSRVRTHGDGRAPPGDRRSVPRRFCGARCGTRARNC